MFGFESPVPRRVARGILQRCGSSWRQTSVGAWAMAYDGGLADRIRSVIEDRDDVAEQRMFGGLAFLVNGNMVVSASGRGGLLLRVDPDETESLVSEAGVTRFEMRGRALDR
ncbi:MAG: TfoX/Sxy family protein [Marmoricola sp.]